ncbi:CDP-alcohol phosphatidyltransferase family protein [Olivibacter sp. XZL3]|uniref:CDP-alcohol phosphatidyltransferase family protein n=1 Tax=Olivibacter sp. XZL3 TaxID=1735116 RepID=UPI001F0DC4CC|nr:CDP-alcohol phosphatidyltransferase family protein [Olivibacter sp. XZL3]
MKEKKTMIEGLENKHFGQVQEEDEKKKNIFKDRKRTNLLKDAEQRSISYLVTKVPDAITPNMLTGIGCFGGMVVLLGFVLASYVDRSYLLLGVLGLSINWLGDSLDGRIAYYRNIPRKWYGFSLDIIMDWINTVIMGLGFIVYLGEGYELLSYFFVALYGWAMIITQLRYKITDRYTIDAGTVGPTEIRVIISIIFILEVIFAGAVNIFSALVVITLFIVNIVDTIKLLRLGDARDIAERAVKSASPDVKEK